MQDQLQDLSIDLGAYTAPMDAYLNLSPSTVSSPTNAEFPANDPIQAAGLHTVMDATHTDNASQFEHPLPIPSSSHDLAMSNPLAMLDQYMTGFEEESMSTPIEFPPSATQTDQLPQTFQPPLYPHPESSLHEAYPPTTDAPPSHPSSSASSVPGSGYITPQAQSESSFYDDQPSVNSMAPFPNPPPAEPQPLTSVDMIQYMLHNISVAAEEARAAMARGEVHLYNNKIHDVLSSVDLMRSLGVTGPQLQYPSVASPPRQNPQYHQQQQTISDYPSAASTRHASDSPSAMTGVHASMATDPSLAHGFSATFSLASPESSHSSVPASSPPSQTIHPSLLTADANADQRRKDAFSRGLSLLDFADPSRKRTISTATARAIDPRAPKAQKREIPVEIHSADGPDATPSQASYMHHAAPASSTSSPSGSASVASSTRQSPRKSIASTAGAGPSNAAAPPAVWSDPAGQMIFGMEPEPPNPPLFLHPTSPSSAPRYPRLGATSTVMPHTSSPLATTDPRFASRSSSFSSTHPSLSSFSFSLGGTGAGAANSGVNQPSFATESSQSSVVFSRPPSPESTTFYSESDADYDMDTDARDEDEMDMDYIDDPELELEVVQPTPGTRSGFSSRRSSRAGGMSKVASSSSLSRKTSRKTMAPTVDPTTVPSSSASAAAAALALALASSDVPIPANLLGSDLKAQVDHVFDLYLQRICSNLDATDSKGEPIHQTLMAKKMKKLDSSMDFRPFKFRIQAFTNAFMDDLAQNGLGEDIIPPKKVKAYLWHQQPIISRFNEDGKKSKSKGNHVWQIEARKKSLEGGGWIFRSFQRKIVGNPAPTAYVGIKWAWEPHVWDPQASRSSFVVRWRGENLPAWLEWKDDILMGVPGLEDKASVDITVVAEFPNEDREPVSSTFHINIVPYTISEQMMGKQRRPSLAGEAITPRRVASDSVVPQGQTLAKPPRVSASPLDMAADPSQVLRVVTEAAQNVAQAQNNNASNPSDPIQAQRHNALAKQQRVLVKAAEALNEAVLDAQSPKSNDSLSSSTAQSTLAQCVREVINEVARQIIVERAARQQEALEGVGVVVPVAFAGLTIRDVSVSLQTAVAQAVQMSSATSTEIEVMMTANAIVKQQGESVMVPPIVGSTTTTPPLSVPAQPLSEASSLLAAEFVPLTAQALPRSASALSISMMPPPSGLVGPGGDAFLLSPQGSGFNANPLSLVDEASSAQTTPQIQRSSSEMFPAFPPSTTS